MGYLVCSKEQVREEWKICCSGALTEMIMEAAGRLCGPPDYIQQRTLCNTFFSYLLGPRSICSSLIAEIRHSVGEDNGEIYYLAAV